MKTENTLVQEIDERVNGRNRIFDEHEVIHEMKHFLPAQAPLKDFIHHNTLHSFQNLKFFDALRNAAEKFGYKVSLSVEEYRELFHHKRIREDILDKVIADHHGAERAAEWKSKLLHEEYLKTSSPRIGALRAIWKRNFRVDLNSLVHPILFRILCSYLDQGISIWSFPVQHEGFLASIKIMERNSMTTFFRTSRARDLLLKGKTDIAYLLKILVGGDGSLYKQYLFDQQFAHQGWSGIVSVVEDTPQTLLDQKKISLHDLITFELLLEIDALDFEFGEIWAPLSYKAEDNVVDLFAEVPVTEMDEVLMLWQQAFEWTYYDEVLAGIKFGKMVSRTSPSPSFQAVFCIDDRECSFRRYLERLDPACETFGTPGFFGVEFFFQPEHGKFYTKVCPQPVTPKYLIKELDAQGKREKEAHFTKHTHSLFRGWLISQTLGFWSAFKLFINIFRPTMSPATASSFRHMDKVSKLTIENRSPDDKENGLQIGFTIPEMVQRVEGLLKSIGLVKNFAPIVYMVGHGSSSVNNPHYAAYDCGACSGRPGSVNARVICHMANHPEVRKELAARGIVIPDTTRFVGGLHDTTSDDVAFYDENALSAHNQELHHQNQVTFAKALDLNSKERARRFVSIEKHREPAKIHKRVRLRSVSLFEPRPELNHATNALCIVGRRELTRGLFLDRRSFLNSYDYAIDPEGNLLYGIMRPLGPVCGGINLEYFFSRVANQKLGAGTKLPHNVMGLFGVANGIDGDLRPGLPSQMIEVHDPVRLMIIVEHFPQVVLATVQRAPEVYEWFINDWVHLVAVNPETRELFVFKDGKFAPYTPLKKTVDPAPPLEPLFETDQDNLPVYSIA